MEHIIRGEPIPKECKFNFNSIGSTLLNSLKKSQDKVLYVDGATSESLSASKILYQSSILANRLLNYGVKPGDIIGIHSENCFEYIYMVLATYFIGGTLTLFNPFYKEDELAYIINLSKPKLIFTSHPETLVQITTKRLQLPTATKIINFSKGSVTNFENYSKFIENTSPLEVFPCETSVKCMDEVCLILYSSGTTGLPKGVLLTQQNLFGYMERNRPILDNKCITFIPMFHIYGFGVLMSTLLFYDNSVLLQRFQDRLFLSCIQKYKVNTIFTVPATFALLARSPLTVEYDLTSIELVICGAAPLPKILIDEIKSKYDAIIRESYGMTETTSGILRQTDEKCKQGSVGCLVYDTLGKIVDVDTGKSLGPNKLGELCFKGAVIMKGYLNNETETRNIIDQDGWIHTGDIGYYDEDEEWFIVDRIKELIKYKGLQVAPAELETILMSHPKIMDAACIGLPDEVAGELPMAFVVLKSGEFLSEREIQEYVAGKVSSSKHLRGGVRFINSIPRNDSGKILRRVLKSTVQNVKSKL